MRRITASRVKLALQCLFPFTSGLPWDEKPSYESALGSAVHKAAEHHVQGVSVSTPMLVTEYRLTTPRPNQRGISQQEKLERMFARYREWADVQDGVKGWRVELAYELRADGSCHALESNGHRDYSKAMPDSITGTVDVVDVNAPEPWFGDIKTGFYVDAPGESDQMHTLNVMIRGAYRLDRELDGKILKVTQDGVFPAGHRFTDAETGAYRARLLTLIDAAKGPQEPRPGEWCKRCPAKGACPEAMTNDAIAV